MSWTSENQRVSEAPELRTYDRAHCVVFHKTREAFGALSNMAAGFPLYVAGVEILTSEALYQACRFPHLPEIQRLIIQQNSPMTAKMKSKPHRNKTREDWDAVRVGIMKWCLKIKLVQHWNRFGEVLLSTGIRPVVEQSRRDEFWGAVSDSKGSILVGSNVLGRLLMDLRERLKKNPDEFSVVFPLPIPHFSLLGREIEPIKRDLTESFESRSSQRRLQLGQR
jgi:ribA/ribD-fused uncharacterized protein